MKVISIKISDNKLIVSSTRRVNNINDNKIVEDTYFYTELFLKVNKSRVKEIFKSMSYDKVIFADFKSFTSTYFLFHLVNVHIEINKSLTPKVMDILVNLPDLESVKCYFMPGDYAYLLAEKNVLIEYTSNLNFDNTFSKLNDFKDLKSVYYKRVIEFRTTQDVINNLEPFLRVNNSLKYIHLYCYSYDILSLIVEKLEEHGFKEVNIFIHQNDKNETNLKSDSALLRKLNKDYSNKKREIKIIYSNEFFRKNIFKELTINGIKLSMIIILYVALILIFADKYHEYRALLELRKLETDLIDREIISIDEIDDTEVEPPVEAPEPEPEEEDINYYANVPTTFDRLLQINSDVVGWLRVNNTKANYPVTQTRDNSYYLNHDIYGNQTIVGWIYMDYRNDKDNLSKNTVIYGHNLTTGYMFGDLKNTTDSSWYLNPDNQIITFNTLNRTMQWKIFSIYRTDYTTDYLNTIFVNDEEFNNFLSMVKSRSIYDFGVSVGVNDYILTLSTCTGSNNRRLAIHAVLISG